MKVPAISILMPVKNYAVYLPACLNSILAQTETDWELIAVDDHSTDRSLSILQAFAKSDSRIRPCVNEGEGLISALRTAFRHSRGIFVTRMDADDLMPRTKLELLAGVLKRSGQIAVGLVRYFADAGSQVGPGYLRYARWLNDLTLKGGTYRQIYRECTIPSSAWMCRRGDFLAAGAFEPEVYPEDYDLCFRFYRSKLEPVVVPEVVHLWRDHARRISRTLSAYADNTFLDLKVPWFLQLDYDASRPLVLYGAGKKGKRIAALLHERGISFYWLCNRPTKWGKSMHGAVWQAPDALRELRRPQVLLALADRRGREEVDDLLGLSGREEGKDFFWFA